MHDPLPIQMSTEEWEAVKLAWNSDQPIPEHEAVRLLVGIRARKTNMEEEFASLAVKRIAEVRRTPRRHQVMALVIGLVALTTLFVVLAIGLR